MWVARASSHANLTQLRSTHVQSVLGIRSAKLSTFPARPVKLRRVLYLGRAPATGALAFISNDSCAVAQCARPVAHSTVFRNSGVEARSSGGHNNGAAEHSAGEHIDGEVGRSSTGHIVQCYRASRQQPQRAEVNSVLPTQKRN
jgi:hypothetical protein